MFRKLVEARDRLLAALGTRAPPPKPPTYAPMGKRMIYRRTSVRPQQGRIGSDPPSAALTDAPPRALLSSRSGCCTQR